jgi:hypothetical protein
MSSSLERLQFDELRELFRKTYFNDCKVDPFAAQRYGDCLRLLCANSPDSLQDAFARHTEPSDPDVITLAARAAVAKFGAGATMEQAQAELMKLLGQGECSEESNPNPEDHAE